VRASGGTILPPIDAVLHRHGVGEIHSDPETSFADDPEQRINSVARSILAPMTKATTVPGAEHYREIAGMLREAARSCQLAGARKEILHLAERFESRADHLDRRAGSMTAQRLV
jgi:hypothetical protein